MVTLWGFKNALHLPDEVRERADEVYGSVKNYIRNQNNKLANL
jgi:hypothetical protein